MATHLKWVCFPCPRFLLQCVILFTMAVLTARPRLNPVRYLIMGQRYLLYLFGLPG